MLLSLWGCATPTPPSASTPPASPPPTTSGSTQQSTPDSPAHNPDSQNQRESDSQAGTSADQQSGKESGAGTTAGENAGNESDQPASASGGAANENSQAAEEGSWEDAAGGNDNDTNQADAQDATMPMGGATGSTDIASGAPNGTNVGLPDGQTPEERSAELEKILGGSLVVFDSAMLEEHKRAAAARRGDNGGSGATPGLEGSGMDGEDGADAGSGTASVQDSDTEQGAARTSTEAARTSVQGAPGNKAGVTPADIPSGDDDDVVARQLREAAQSETDPVLREKLWDEYRRYKTGSGN